MTLLRPEYAWLFATVPASALALVLARTRRRRLAGLIPRGPRHREYLQAACFLGGVFLLALAAAGPGIGRSTAQATGGPGRLLVALDCSRSMLAHDLAPDRLGAAKRLARDVLSRLPDVPAGLVLFAGQARLACPVTADRDALLLFLDAASPDDVPLGGTNLEAALEACRLALVGGDPGAVLLLSDGEQTLATPDASAGKGPAVVTVAVGGALPASLPDRAGGAVRDAAGEPVLVGVDVAALAALADARGGAAFRLSPDAPFPGAAVARVLARLVPSGKAETDQPPKPVDRTLACLGLGLVLLVAELLFFPAARTILLTALVLVAAVAGPVRADTSAAQAVALGLAALAQGRFEAARDHFLAARARDPDAPEILYDLGTAYYRLGQYDRALAAFDRAARASRGIPRARALYNKGNAAFRLGDSVLASGCYEAALAEDPADADARANLEWLRSRQAPSPPPPDGQDGGDARGAGGKAATETPGQASRPGQAPEAAGQDPGRDTGQDPPAGDTPPPESQAAAPATADRPGPDAAAAPLAAAEGMAAGARQTGPDSQPGTPLFDRVPDLPGLPRVSPRYARPTVEKDW